MSYLSHRFSETEAVVIITMMISRYTITVKDEPAFAHETFEQRKERVLRWESGITLRQVLLI